MTPYSVASGWNWSNLWESLHASSSDWGIWERYKGSKNSSATLLPLPGVNYSRTFKHSKGKIPSKRENPTCYKCGGPHLAPACKFINSECKFCKKKGHIAHTPNLQDVLPIPGRNLWGSKHGHCHSNSLNTILNEGSVVNYTTPVWWLNHSRMMLHDIIDYAFITSILYICKTLQLSLSFIFHMFLHFIHLQYLLSCNERFC